MSARDTTARWITFPSGTDQVRAYLAEPSGTDVVGAIVCAPENLGVTEHRQAETRRLAAEGFIVLTVDPYSRIGGRPPQDYTTVEERRSKAFIAARDETVVPDCQAALEWLRGHPRVAAQAIGAVGYCLGGGTVLAWAAQTRDLACSVVLYALPVIPAAYTPDGQARSRIALAPKIAAPMQLHFGEADEAIALDQAQALKDALETRAPVPVDFHLYPGARHAYMDDTLDRYSPEAAKLTYGRMVAFFRGHLKVPS
ncbi:MAG: dienelactone hydrolase family protein [Hydrogenophaga sp.]|jgi:carboxymethylenebutenolidase|uniref:dienelactone hydrolase family protein n=1 Tax=Hydrogenophaga sp. TaxID=1904254 RepID=UPI0026216E5A|nr:dienelactone hydrolase family protein [Hydrogenophaga sp.]MCW5668768.1 dienelactone hydrolase family protein [Hydrogenophaga sp.]